ncbi:MAG: hypothetical protein P4M08_05935 [Oligoflexia bacterium]|nr:hypothetical protein [Oligoflexia bacterium]
MKTLLFLASTLLVSQAAFAFDSCWLLGSGQAVCESNADCVWVDSSSGPGSCMPTEPASFSACEARNMDPSGCRMTPGCTWVPETSGYCQAR